MDGTYFYLYREVIGPRGGRKWVRVGYGVPGMAFRVRQPGTYRLTRYVNGWPATSQPREVTEEDLAHGPVTLAPEDFGGYWYSI